MLLRDIVRFKSNFATLDTETGIVVSRRADRRFEALGPVLCDHLDGALRPDNRHLCDQLQDQSLGWGQAKAMVQQPSQGYAGWVQHE